MDPPRLGSSIFQPSRRRRKGEPADARGHHALVGADLGRWPATADELVGVQLELAQDADVALETAPWRPGAQPLVGGCFVAFARGEAGPGRPGDRAWAGAVVWWSGGPHGELRASSVHAERVP